jgi:hypothetical protein
MVENKNRERLPSGGAGSRFRFGVHFSFGTSRGDVKGTDLISVAGGGVTGFAPRGAVPDDPIREGTLETDVVAGLLGLDPLVAQNLLAFRLKLAVKRGVFQQIVRRR